MGSYTIKLHKMTVLSCCKSTSEVRDTWRKHCPANELRQGGEEFSYCLTAYTFRQYILKCSHHFSFILIYLLVPHLMCCWVSLNFFESCRNFGPYLHACIFPNKFSGAVGHLFAVTKQKQVKCQKMSVIHTHGRHIWDHVQVAAVLHSSFILLSLVSVTCPLA